MHSVLNWTGCPEIYLYTRKCLNWLTLYFKEGNPWLQFFKSIFEKKKSNCVCLFMHWTKKSSNTKHIFTRTCTSKHKRTKNRFCFKYIVETENVWTGPVYWCIFSVCVCVVGCRGFSCFWSVLIQSNSHILHYTNLSKTSKSQDTCRMTAVPSTGRVIDRAC